MINQKLVYLAGYLDALHKLYRRAGGRLLPWGSIGERLAICKECEHFTGRKCQLCGCCTNDAVSHFNKLAFPTERCPDDPPRWLEVEDDI